MSPVEEEHRRAREDTGSGTLILTGSSLDNPSLPILVRAAATAGFDALSVWPAHEYEHAREEGYSDADLRALLELSGVTVNDLDAVVVWAGKDDPGGPYLLETSPDAVFSAARALNARAVNVLIVGSRETPPDVAALAFGRVCDRAAKEGLLATLEFIPPSVVRDLEQARTVVALADRDNGRLLVDACHLWRSGWPLDRFALLASGLVDAVQLADLPPDGTAAPKDELGLRLIPGDGVMDLAALLHLMKENQPDASVSVEVFNRQLARALGPELMAKRLAAAVRSLLAQEQSGDC